MTLVGKGLKEFAQRNNFKIEKKYAYGTYKGFVVTIFEGMGFKSMIIATHIRDTDAAALRSWFETSGYVKKYAINAYFVGNSQVGVNLNDTVGTMKRYEEFIDVLCDYLISVGAKGEEYCSFCGKKFGEEEHFEADSPVHDERALVYYDASVLPMHTSCMQKIVSDVNQVKAEAQNGNTPLGLVGAVLGALIGAIPWVIVQMLGFFVGWCGAIIGFCSAKGYDMMHGKQTKFKIFAVIIATIIAVCVAVFAGEALVGMQAFKELAAEYGYSTTNSQLFKMVIEAIKIDPDIQREILGNLVLGMMFAALGMISVVRTMSQEHASQNELPVRIDMH